MAMSPNLSVVLLRGTVFGLAAIAVQALIEAHVLAAERLHGDETTVPILAKGQTVTGQIGLAPLLWRAV